MFKHYNAFSEKKVSSMMKIIFVYASPDMGGIQSSTRAPADNQAVSAFRCIGPGQPV
jgi:hypothetical protein